MACVVLQVQCGYMQVSPCSLQTCAGMHTTALQVFDAVFVLVSSVVFCKDRLELSLRLDLSLFLEPSLLLVVRLPLVVSVVLMMMLLLVVVYHLRWLSLPMLHLQ